MARNIWYLSLGFFVMLPSYIGLHPSPDLAKAHKDTRYLARAISDYFAHCSGLPADSSRTDCPVAAEPGGPHPLPQSLLVRQTNARGQVAGPFLKRWPQMPKNWTGAAKSYAYYILPGGRFVICAKGDGTGPHEFADAAANSDGNSTCP